jgi:putative heme iron utilization protein
MLRLMLASRPDGIVAHTASHTMVAWIAIIRAEALRDDLLKKIPATEFYWIRI